MLSCPNSSFILVHEDFFFCYFRSNPYRLAAATFICQAYCNENRLNICIIFFINFYFWHNSQSCKFKVRNVPPGCANTWILQSKCCECLFLELTFILRLSRRMFEESAVRTVDFKQRQLRQFFDLVLEERRHRSAFLHPCVCLTESLT